MNTRESYSRALEQGYLGPGEDLFFLFCQQSHALIADENRAKNVKKACAAAADRIANSGNKTWKRLEGQGRTALTPRSDKRSPSYGFRGMSLNDLTILFLVILWDRTVSVR